MRLRWILLLALTATSCSQFHDSPLSPSQNLDAFESRTLDRADLKDYVQANIPTSQWPLKTWGLTDLTLAAFYYHPEMDVARAQFATIQGELITAGERPNPSISISPGFNSDSGASLASGSSWIVDTALDIPIETANKRGYRIAQTQHLSEAARLNIASTAWLVRSRVRQALLEIHAAQQTQAQLIRQQAIQSDNVQLLSLQLAAGEVSPFEVSQARIPLNATRLAVIEAQGRQIQARAQLATAIGVPARALENIALSFDAIADLPQLLPTEETRRQALLSRPDVLAALAEYLASQSALQLEIAKQYPDLNIGPGYSYDQRENKWSIGVSLTLPVFNQNQGGILTAEGRRAETAARFRALQASIIGQIEQAMANYESSINKFQAAQSLAEELMGKTESTRKMFEAGEILKLEVIAADLEVGTNALAQLNARIEALQALGEIENVLQQPVDLSQWQQVVLQRNVNSQKETHHE